MKSITQTVYSDLRSQLFKLEAALAGRENTLTSYNHVLTDATGMIAYRVGKDRITPCSLADAPLYTETDAIKLRPQVEQLRGHAIRAININAALVEAIKVTKENIDTVFALLPKKMVRSSMPKCQRRAIMARTPTIDTRDLFRGTATLVVYDAGLAVEEGDEAEECLNQRHFIKCFMGQEYLRKGVLSASRLPR